jgi:oxygen-dependent protoporphyrinogen oxidase
MATPDATEAAGPARGRVVVVGGGIAGLTAARRLSLAGHEVTVIERSDRLGGQVARQTVCGISLDAGAESFATRGGTVARLAEALGIGHDIVTPLDAPAWLHRTDGTAVPLPATNLLGIPAFPLAADVVAAIGSRAAWWAQRDQLLLGQFGARARTLGELVRRRMGQGVLDGLVAPVVRGVYSAHPDDLELDVVAPGLRSAFLREGSLIAAVRALADPAVAGARVAGISGGMVRLVAALAAELEGFGVTVRSGAEVVAVDEAGATIAGGERVAGTVVIAAPGVTEPADPARVVTLVTLVVDAPELDSAPRGTGVLVAAGAGVEARALTHLSAKWRWVAEAANGRHVLRLSYDGGGGGSEAAAVKRAAGDAAILLGVRIGVPEDASVITWERAAPRTYSVDGMRYVGEAVAGTGIAAVVAQADGITADRPETDSEPQG